MGIAEQTTHMADLNDRDQAVLAVLAGGRANPKLIRDETGLDKGAVNSVLVKMIRHGLVRRITEGLYELTGGGHELVEDPDNGE